MNHTNSSHDTTATPGMNAAATRSPGMLPAFKSDTLRDRYMAAYDAMLRDWPVAFEEFDLTTRLGPTHVIASGPPDAPPLLLLPSFAARPRSGA